MTEMKFPHIDEGGIDLDEALQMPGIVTRLEPEVDRAARHKAALVKALEGVRLVAEEARKDGYYIEFGINLDQFGRYTIQPPAGLIKRF